MTQREIYKLVKQYDESDWTAETFAQMLFGRIVAAEREAQRPKNISIQKVEIVLENTGDPSRVAREVRDALERAQYPKDRV